MLRTLFIFTLVVLLTGCSKRDSTEDKSETVPDNSLPALMKLLEAPLDSIPPRFFSLLKLDSTNGYGNQELYRIEFMGKVAEGKIVVVNKNTKCTAKECWYTVTVFGLYEKSNKINRSEDMTDMVGSEQFDSFEHEMFLRNNDALMIVFFNDRIAPVREFSKPDLRLMRNHIFARYGYIFKDPELQRYFKQFAWYNPQVDNVDEKLTENDKLIIQDLQKMEKE